MTGISYAVRSVRWRFE